MDMRPYGKGLYWVALVDEKGKRLAMSRVVVNNKITLMRISRPEWRGGGGK